MSALEFEDILIVGGEGGGAEIRGVRTDGHWKFRVEKSDQSAAMLGEPTIESQSDMFDNLDDAIRAIQWPWNHLYPVRVHPEFGQQIYAHKVRLDSEDDPAMRRDDRWRHLCGIEAGLDNPNDGTEPT